MILNKNIIFIIIIIKIKIFEFYLFYLDKIN